MLTIKRHAVEFLDKLVGVGSTNFKIKQEADWELYKEAIEAFREARQLLVAYGDPGSHGGEVTVDEADKTITACELAWNFFKCEDCGDYVWIADLSGRERKQCSCGKLRWKYG